MKLILSIIVILSLCIGCTATQKSVNSDNSFVLTHINIVDVAGQKIQHDKHLVIVQGKIVDILSSHQINQYPQLKRISGYGGFITPGLIDMHVHMYEPAAYLFALSHGVTHVRIMNGIPAHLKWREQINSGQLIGSSSTVSSPILSGYENAHLHHTVKTKQQAQQAVKQYHSEGYDLIKAYGNLSEEALSAIISEAARLNMPVAKHGPHGSGDMPLNALSNLQSFEHVEDIYQGLLEYQFETDGLDDIISELKATNTPITPTLNIFAQLTNLSQYKEQYLLHTKPEYTSELIAFEANKNQVKRWLTASNKMIKHNQKTLAFLIDITKKLNQNEIPLLVGSDSGVLLSPHGIATHKELKLLEQAGLSPYQALKAATINPAKALGLEKQMGQIKTNYQADFIYTLSNPIDNLSVLEMPMAVIKEGRWVSQQTFVKMRQDAIDSRSLWQELIALAQAL